MGARLRFGTRLRVDHQQRGGSPRRAGDEIADEFAVTRTVDDDQFASRRAHMHARRVERHRLIALELQRVERERPLERHAAARTRRLQLGHFAVGKEVEFVQQAPQQRRLAMVDVPGKADRERACHHM